MGLVLASLACGALGSRPYAKMIFLVVTALGVPAAMLTVPWSIQVIH